jgi:hypothetical protein
MSDMRSDLDQLNAWYEALGSEDPEFAKFREEADSKYSTLQGQYDEMKLAYEGQQEQWENLLVEDAKRYADWFWEQNADIKEDPKLMDRLQALVQHGFDGEDAAKLCKLPDDVVEQAAKAMKQGAPSSVAVQMAELYAAKQVPAKASSPNSSALLVDDGSTRQRTSDTKPTMREMKTPEERRLFAARSALKKHGL